LELILLKRNEKLWLEYEKQPETLFALQGIFYLLSHPDLKNIEFEPNLTAPAMSPFNQLFMDPMSLKDVIKIVKNLVKNKLAEDDVVKTIIKGVTKQLKKPSSNFEVELKDNEFKKITFKRKKITSYKHGISDSSAGLPIVSWTSTAALNSMPHIYQTIKAAILDASFDRNPFHIHIKNRHFRYPVYQQKQNFNIMLVLDISNSVKWILKFMARIISMLTAQANASKDKLGLIIFNDDRAQIMHFPTTNIRHVIGTINTLAPSGASPLAEGMQLAMQTLEHSRFQVTGMSNAIVLLSDCFPEPITGEHKDPLDEPVCQQILHVCDKIAENKIKLLVLNPSLNNMTHYEQQIGYTLGKKAAERANGNFLNLVANVCGFTFSEEEKYVLPDQMLKKFVDEIGDFRMGSKF
jgi:Mg-chelatase subunit ChlD